MKTASATAVQSHLNAALQAQAKGDLLMAQQEHVQALIADPCNATAMLNLGLIFMATERMLPAITLMERLTVLDPDNFQAWHNLGYFYGTIGRFEDCAIAIRKSLAIQPAYQGYYVLGLTLYQLGRWQESLAAYDEALRLRPDDVQATDDRSNVLLAMGEFKSGFLDNKVRWKYAAAHPFMHAAVPEWEGQELVGKTIVVLHEQGYGDSLQFMRFIPWLKSKFGAARVAYSVRPTMIGLCKLANLADDILDINNCDSVNPDYKTPILTLPAYAGLTKDNIPGKPYVKAPMRKRVLPKDGRKKVGIVWGGIPMYSADKWRSMNPLDFLPIFKAKPDIKFYALQQDDRRAQLWQTGCNAFAEDLSTKLTDWLDTAAIVKELDLLISVDTATAHLAGGMGKPVALMIPQAGCWRWMDHDTTTTPWYPSMKLYRQTTQGDWSVPINKLIEDLT